MSTPSYDQEFWEQLWERTLRERGDMVNQKPPSPLLTETAASLTPGRALDAGCGHGAESLWLAGHGWSVTGVDFSISALEHAAKTAAALDPEIAARTTWVEGDLGTWNPEPAAFDLVVCLYVHIAGEPEEFVRRMASGVAPGGTLLMVGHQAIDPETGEETRAAGQLQVSVAHATAALTDGWDLEIAEERHRTDAISGVDAVIRARRSGSASTLP